jgi:ABC-type nitrate/sulfonate/bicarbonate transport system substrate-binding protein
MSTRPNRRAFLRQVIGVAGAGVVVPLLASCAPPAAPASPTAAPPAAAAGGATAATTAPATPKNVTKVSYAFASVNPFHYVAVVATEKPDLPHKFGIEFDLVTTTNSPNAVNALVGGSVDVAAATPDSMWPALDKAPDVKQVWPMADGTPYVLLAQPEFKKAADLKGQTFGASAVRGGADTAAIMIMMSENGLTPNDYTIVQAGAVADRTAAMKAHTIQALAQIEPQATLLRDEGFPEIDNANNYPPLKSVHSIVVAAKKSWYQDKAEVAANFARSWDGITKWIYDPANKDEVLAITKKTMSVDAKPAENAYNLHVGSKTLTPNLRFNEAYMQQFVQNLKKIGTENLPSDPMTYVDGSVVASALKG